jgi:DNA-binding IclR family transcriptional regulator
MIEQVATSVKSADRVLDVFEALGAWNMGMTHTRLAEHLGIPKSSLSQLLRTMVQRGYIRFSGEDRTYHIGPAIEALAGHKREILDLTNIIQPYLERITAATGESTFLNLLSGDMAHLTARVIGPQPLVTVLTLGQMVPLYATAGARAILAFLPSEMREDYLQRTQLKAFTEKTVTSVSKLREELDRVRTDQLSISSDELFMGITGIAVPVLSGGGHALGSVVVSMPTTRLNDATRRSVGVTLREHVARLQTQLISSSPQHGS